MQAETDREGNVYAVYRTANNNESRDINLLVSKDGGQAFESKILEKWPVNTCPMSSMSLLELPDRMLVGWETDRQIRFTKAAKGSIETEKTRSPSGVVEGGKHPVFATGFNGNVLVVWTEGTGWNQGGAVAWQEFDASMLAVSKIGRLPEAVPVWGLVASYFSSANKTFYIVH